MMILKRTVRAQFAVELGKKTKGNPQCTKFIKDTIANAFRSILCIEVSKEAPSAAKKLASRPRISGKRLERLSGGVTAALGAFRLLVLVLVLRLGRFSGRVAMEGSSSSQMTRLWFVQGMAALKRSRREWRLMFLGAKKCCHKPGVI